MLLEMSITNFKSILDKVQFSMIASKDTSHEKELYTFGSTRILRMAPLYGANGAGKTTLIEAIGYICFLVRECNKFQEGDVIPRKPHRLSLDEPTQISVQFIINNIRYVYGISITDQKIIEEYLYHFPAGRQAKIFERQGDEFTFGAKYAKELSDICIKSKDNKLFLSTAEAWSKLPEIVQPFKFFKEQVVVHIGEDDNWLGYTANVIKNDANMKKMVLKFFQEIGMPIKDINIKIEDEDMVSLDMPTQIRGFIKGIKKLEIKFIYENYELNLPEESAGTQKLFKLICPLLDVLSKGKILFYDEIERSLHPAIILNLLKVIKAWESSCNAQFVFSTHDTSLLDLNLFRRDQIWFAEKNLQRKTSEYYSLIELKNVRKDENIKNGYITGRYSMIPLKGSSLIEVLEGDAKCNEILN